jgi:PPOX class probable F420-dependent enzyme
MSRAWVEGIRSLLEAPAPAVLTTYRQDGSAHTVPVWFRWTGDALEVVIAKGDVKLRHLARDPRCVLVVFETVRPFRGVEVRGEAELVEGDVNSARAAIAGRYLGVEDGERFTAERCSRPGVLLRLVPDGPRGLGPVGHPAILINPQTVSTHRPRMRAGWAN